MSKWLFKKFIKDYENTADPSVRAAYGKLSGIIGIILNLTLFACKMAVGVISGSLSITADAVNNLSDASSSIISLLGFKLASRPADDEHPYGHGRYEYLSGLMVCVIIILIGFELLKSSAEKIINPSHTEFSVVFAGTLVFSILIKIWMSSFNSEAGKAISSKTLKAAAADSRNDVLATSAVLASFVISGITGIDLDGFMGFAVALFILYSGYGLIKDTIDPLLGHAPDPQAVEYIKKKILSYEGVLGTHDLMIHDYGPGRQFASVHVEMAAEQDVISSHDVIDTIERDFKNHDGLNMIVHYDPIITYDSSTTNIRRWISEKIKEISPELEIHDLRTVPGSSRTNVVFDCVMPYSVEISEKELCSRISRMVIDAFPNHYCIITIDRDFAAKAK